MPTCELRDHWESLTEKQGEAIALVAEGYTSKEGARLLGIAPKTFDHRIKAVCDKLGCATRNEAARIYRDLSEHREQIPYPSFPIPDSNNPDAGQIHRSHGEQLRFADASTEFVELAPWRRSLLRPVPEFRPSEVGPGTRLLLMLGAALVLAAVAMLVVGVANGLDQLVSP